MSSRASCRGIADGVAFSQRHDNAQGRFGGTPKVHAFFVLLPVAAVGEAMTSRALL